MHTQSPIQRIPYTAPHDDFVAALERYGCAVIAGFTNASVLAKAQAEVQPYLDDDTPASSVSALEGTTKTCTRLIGRSQTVREKFFSDPLYQDLVEHFLAITTTNWYNDVPSTYTTHPLLSIAITMDVRPGTLAQRLHRDDKNHHARHTQVDTYHRNRDILLGLFVPGCKTSQENGATRVVPGSHLWGDEKPDFGSDGTRGVVNADLEVGEAFLMLGSLYHGGGQYSMADGTRTMHIMFCCSGVYRQEEISYLSYPTEDVRTYSKVVQQRLGWVQSEPNLGWVDLKSPEFLLS